MAQKKYGWKNFFQLIISAKPANWIISCALVASVITTVAGLIVPLFTKKLIDGFSVSSLDGKVVALIVIAFILQAITNGFSIFLLNYMGKKLLPQFANVYGEKLCIYLFLTLIILKQAKW